MLLVHYQRSERADSHSVQWQEPPFPEGCQPIAVKRFAKLQ